MATPEPSFDMLARVNQPWTAALALELLPENNGPRIAVFAGNVVVSPHAGFDHQSVELELCYRLKQAARKAGMWAYTEVNIVSGEDLFIPDIVVLRRSGGGLKKIPISEAVLLGEIVSDAHRRKDLIDRPREYALAGVPYFLRVECRNRVPSMVFHVLSDGAYRPVAAAASGDVLIFDEPFPFSIDPGDLLDDEEPAEPVERDVQD